MRAASVLGSLTLALLSGSLTFAAAVPYSAVVVQSEAEVRSGASNDPRLYPTNRLRQGAVVQVLEERSDGWLAIRPPEGSFSWINRHFLQQVVPNQPVWMVVTHPNVRVPVLVGSELKKDGRPTVEGARVPRGTQVRVIGPALTDEEGVWLPIEPPPGELRYIRAEAVSRNPLAQTGGAASPAPAGTFQQPTGGSGSATSSFVPGAASAAAPAAGGSAAPLDSRWQQAQQADRAGRTEEAIQLYQQVASAAMNSNHELAMSALNRANWLREANRPAQGQGQFPSTLVAAQPGAGSPAQPAFKPQTQPAATPQAPDAVIRTSGPGWLRKSGRTLDATVMYRLDSDRGWPVLYVAPQPGVNLEAHVNRRVELFGPASYHGEIRANVMTVVRIQPLQ